MFNIITPPTCGAVSLAELKGYLRITHDQADATLQAMLDSAQEAVEKQLGMKLITQRVRFTCARWRISKARGFESTSGTRIHVRLPVSPVQTIHEVVRVWESGARKVIPEDQVSLHQTGTHADLCVPGTNTETLEVEATVGFGADQSAVPAPLKLAILMMAQSAFQGKDFSDLKGLKVLLKPYLKRGV